MSSMFKTAAQWLQRKRSNNAAVAIGYIRNAVTYSFNAWIGRTRYEDVDENGMVIRSETRDYFVKIADFSAAGLNEPVVGDIITETINEEYMQFEVCQVLGQPHYNKDPQHLYMRIHTNRISEE